MLDKICDGTVNPGQPIQVVPYLEVLQLGTF